MRANGEVPAPQGKVAMAFSGQAGRSRANLVATGARRGQSRATTSGIRGMSVQFSFGASQSRRLRSDRQHQRTRRVRTKK
jgi:hypothetical protein